MEESNTSFSSFWKRSKDKLSSRTLTFLPTATPDKSEDDPKQSKKESADRRAQVRRAQKNHRQRKENYQRHLEQDVVHLREMLAVAQMEEAALQEENSAIKNTLLLTEILFSPSDNVAARSSAKAAGYGLDTSRLITAGSHHDETLGTSCLHLYHDSYSDDLGTSHFASYPSDFSNQDNSLSATDAAMNFILALEHPCRTHFSPQTFSIAPEGEPSGHMLMASTYLYDCAPPPAFSFASSTSPTDNSTTWTLPIPPSPSISLKSLHDLSSSLELHAEEITPVQGWFELVRRYGVGKCLKKDVMERLKAELGTKVACFGFGAVMDRTDFEEVVLEVFSGVEVVGP